MNSSIAPSARHSWIELGTGGLTRSAYVPASSAFAGSRALAFVFAFAFVFFSGFGGAGTSTSLNGFSGPGL